jgi:hypothetical protein
MAAIGIAIGPEREAAASGAKALNTEQRHRILIAAAVAAVLDGPFRIVGISPSPDAENRWAKSGRFRNRAQRPPSWAIQPATPPEPEQPAEPEMPPENGDQT